MDSKVTRIESHQLRLVPFSPEHLLALLKGTEHFLQVFGLPAAPGLRDFYASDDISPGFLSRLNEPGCPHPWVFGFAVIDRASDQVVGCAGFKGPPDDDGVVEIAYAVVPEFEGRGLATEAANELIAFALRDPRVHTILAHTLPSQNASTRVLTKNSFAHVGSVVDPVDGPVWRWERKRASQP